MAVRKRSISISGHATSFSLEDDFWTALLELAALEGQSVASLVKQIDENRRDDANLSSAIRTALLSAARQGRFSEN